MPENKTQRTRVSAAAFIGAVDDEQKRKDCRELAALMAEVTGKPAKMWGGSIVGFDQYHYRYESGREGDSPVVGFSPRRQDIVIYVTGGLEGEPLLGRLGKHKAMKSCLHVKRLDDVDREVLRELVRRSWETNNEQAC